MARPEQAYDGTKRYFRQGTLPARGLVLGVHAASLHDRDGGAQVLLADERREDLPRLWLVWADGAYTSEFRRWAQEERGWRVEVTHLPIGSCGATSFPGEAVGLSGVAEEADGRGNLLRVARPSSPTRQGLRAAAGDWVAMVHAAMSRIMLRLLARVTC
jgi:putative transposase